MEINILFIWIPKCGGYSIFTLFNLNRDYINNTDSDTYNYNFNNNQSVTFGHADIYILLEKNVLSKDFYNNSFKFCIVRNPYDRVVSAFFYNKLNRKYTFKNFIKHLYENKLLIPKNSYKNSVSYGDINNQWNPMYTWIPDDINKIYYFENYDNIPKDVIKQININIDLSTIPIINKSEHSNYVDYYDNETAELVYDIYKIDFEKFGYSKDMTINNSSNN